jgi:hypothetical protein
MTLNKIKRRRSSSDSRFITKKVMAMVVSAVVTNFAITRSKLKRRLPCPNLPSI